MCYADSLSYKYPTGAHYQNLIAAEFLQYLKRIQRQN